MKARRQMKILEIIRSEVVQTQEELAEKLAREGMEVTQATVSRDIKELQLIKVPNGDGRYRYAIPNGQSPRKQAERLKRIFKDAVLAINASENLIVVKTLSGTAPGVGEAIDTLDWPEVVGTVAGDNTVLVVAKDRETVPGVLEKLKDLLR